MRWQHGRRSGNVVDRRGAGTRIAAGGGALGIVIAIVYALLGGDPTVVLDPRSRQVATSPSMAPEEEQRLADFVSVVLADTEDVWHGLFREMGRTYEEPKLVLFSGAVDSACGFASAAVGPFYCPPDAALFIDLAFYADLERKLGAPGDFAQAYVIAHEVGHHVQHLLGVSDRVRRAQRGLSESEGNELSVRLELQADFYAGVWAHHARARGVLEAGDVEEALRAAAAIGDDRLQMQAQGYVVLDSFTHGTSEQRARWFRLGLETGDPARGNTFDDDVFAAAGTR